MRGPCRVSQRRFCRHAPEATPFPETICVATSCSPLLKRNWCAPGRKRRQLAPLLRHIPNCGGFCGAHPYHGFVATERNDPVFRCYLVDHWRCARQSGRKRLLGLGSAFNLGYCFSSTIVETLPVHLLSTTLVIFFPLGKTVIFSML